MHEEASCSPQGVFCFAGPAPDYENKIKKLVLDKRLQFWYNDFTINYSNGENKMTKYLHMTDEPYLYDNPKPKYSEGDELYFLEYDEYLQYYRGNDLGEPIRVIVYESWVIRRGGFDYQVAYNVFDVDAPYAKRLAFQYELFETEEETKNLLGKGK
jgi:hypothetical protein